MILNLLDRMKLPFRKNKEFLSVLYEILGFYPHNIEVYRIAFSHKSLAYHREDKPAGKDRRNRERRYRNTDTGQKPLNNERLEYLGDAVLESIVSDILFRHYPHKREGFLTSTRSKIVQRETLNRLALDLGLEKLIQAAEGTNMVHTNIAGNAFEALMGAIYLDRGYKHCHWFISNRVIGRYIDIDNMAHKEVNFKSKLLEWSQKNRINIDFRDHAGEQNEKGFRCVISLEGIVMGRGNGRSKKESQQLAAKEVLTLMRRDAALYDSIFRAKEKRTAMEAEESFALPKIDEIEESLHREQNQREGKSKGKAPVLEEKKPRLSRNASDEAYDTAYDEQAEYEVIDTEPEPPKLTADDYAAKGLPMPPSEDDAVENGPKPKRARTRNRKEKAAENAPAKDTTQQSQEKQPQPAAQPQTKRPADRTAATEEKVAAPEKAKGIVQPSQAHTPVTVTDVPEANTDMPKADATNEHDNGYVAPQPKDNLPQADDSHVQPLPKPTEEKAMEAEQLSILCNEPAASETPHLPEELTEQPDTAETNQPLPEPEATSEQVQEVVEEPGNQPVEPVEQQANPTDTIPDDLEEIAETIQKEIATDEHPDLIILKDVPPVNSQEADEALDVMESDFSDSADEAEYWEDEAEEVAEKAEEEPEEEPNELPASRPTPSSLHTASPKPILRHLSIDDFVFGVDQHLTEPFELDDEAETATVRKPNRRRRRPARKPATAQETPQTEQQTDRKPAGEENNRSRRRKTQKKASQPVEQEATNNEKPAKPRRRRRRPTQREE